MRTPTSNVPRASFGSLKRSVKLRQQLKPPQLKQPAQVGQQLNARRFAKKYRGNESNRC